MTLGNFLMKKLLLGSLLISSIALSLSGCVPQQGSYHPKLYTSGSKAKGVVAMLPVFSQHARNNEILPWSLQKEFTEGIVKRLSDSDRIYLIKHNASAQVVSHFFSPSTTALPTSLISDFLPAEFVVATELLEQKTVSDPSGIDSICASVRVRVFDIRHQKINLIYQEILDASQPITNQNHDYYRYGWRSKNFDATPMGIMHQRLFREIVARVEGYICANYS